MEEQNQSKPPFYNIVDRLFHGVMDTKFVTKNFKYFKDRPGLSAAVLGTTGTLAGLETTKLATEALLPTFYKSNFDSVEELALLGLTGALIYYSDKIGSWAEKHSVYTPGMVATIISAYGYAITDLLIK